MCWTGTQSLATDASVPFSGWQEGKQALRRVVRVLDDVGSTVLHQEGDLHQEGERGTNYSAGRLHSPV